jgi:hypothetical protein
MLTKYLTFELQLCIQVIETKDENVCADRSPPFIRGIHLTLLPQPTRKNNLRITEFRSLTACTPDSLAEDTTTLFYHPMGATILFKF